MKESINITLSQDEESLRFEENLDEQAKQKIEKYKNVRFMHPTLSNTMSEVLKKYHAMEKGDFLFIAGSTGVGKSILGEQLKLHLLSQEIDLMKSDRNYQPVVYQNAYQSDSSNFDFKLFYENVSKKIGDILPNEKQRIEYRQDGSIDISSLKKKKNTAREMRLDIEEGFLRRGTHTFFIDEIQHMLAMRSHEKIKDRMDFIKSFTESANVKIIMIGTYEALQMSGLSAQLGRRNLFVDFPRYKCETKEQLEEWIKVVWECQRRLPLKDKECLVPHYKMLFRFSCGCTGILKKWINLALTDALASSLETITEEILLANRAPINTLDKIASEICEGEKKLMLQNADKLNALYDNANMDFPPHEKEKQSKPRNKQAEGLKPGEQKPKLMKTGR